MVIETDPMGKPRMTQRDKWAHRPVIDRYYAYCDELRYKHPEPLDEVLVLKFVLPMPKSWSKKKREEMYGKPHQQKPDIDNLCKGVMDALAKEDSYIHTIHARKIWGGIGYIRIG